VYSRRRTSRPPALRGLPADSGGEAEPSPAHQLEWSWPPYAPVETDVEPFDTGDWAPASVVWHPQVRVGRWTVVYRRAA